LDYQKVYSYLYGGLILGYCIGSIFYRVSSGVFSGGIAISSDIDEYVDNEDETY